MFRFAVSPYPFLLITLYAPFYFNLSFISILPRLRSFTLVNAEAEAEARSSVNLTFGTASRHRHRGALQSPPARARRWRWFVRPRLETRATSSCVCSTPMVDERWTDRPSDTSTEASRTSRYSRGARTPSPGTDISLFNNKVLLKAYLVARRD